MLSPIAFFAIGVQKTWAQIELQQGMQYLYSMSYYNPAFSGVNGQLNVSSFFKAPSNFRNTRQNSTIGVSADGLIDERFAAAGNYVREVFGNDTYSAGNLSGAVHINVNDADVLSSGISLGVQQYGINVLDLTTATTNDPAAYSNVYSTKLNAGAGIRFAHFDSQGDQEKYYLGLSFTNLLSVYNNRNSLDNEIPGAFRRVGMYAIAGGNFSISDEVKLNASALFSKYFADNAMLDLGWMVKMQVISLGVYYRYNSTSYPQNQDSRTLQIRQSSLRPMLQLGFLKGQRLKLSYAYDVNIGSTQQTVKLNSSNLALIYSLPSF